MILEELRLLKSFSNSMDSTITEQDIAAKERELGIKLPEALRELYLTFNPEDPIFSIWMQLVPLEEIQIEQLEQRKFNLLETVDYIKFLKNSEWSAGFVLRKYRQKQLVKDYLTNGNFPVFHFYTAPKTKWEREYIEEMEQNLTEWIEGVTAFLVVFSQPNLVALNGLSSFEYRNQLLVHLDQVFEVKGFGLSVSKGTQDVLKISYHIWPINLSAKYTFAFGTQTEKAMNEFIALTGLKFDWLKRDGEILLSVPKRFEQPQSRELYAITPILEFLRSFAGITEPGLSEAQLEKAENRLGPLPLPVKEYYRLFPKSLYHTHNNLRPLSGLRKTKSGIFFFLEENQNCCQWGFSADSPFLYCREPGGKWAVSDLLDSFLTQEFAWEIMSSEELDMEFEEVSNFKPEIMELGGTLASQFTNIAGLSQKLAWPLGAELFRTPDGKSVALYNRGEASLYIMSKDEENRAE